MKNTIQTFIRVLVLLAFANAWDLITYNATAQTLPVWQRVNIANLPAGCQLGAVWSRNLHEAYVWASRVVANSPEAYLFRWDGLSWNQAFALTNYTPAKVYGTGASDAFISLNYFPNGYNNPAIARIFRSSDNGLNWTLQALPPAVANSDVGFGYFGGTINNVHVTIGNDRILRFDGTAWNLAFTGSRGFYGLTLVSATEGYYVTCHHWGSWNGANRVDQDSADLGCDVYGGVWGKRENDGSLHLYATGQNSFNNGVRIWHFNEAGQTWSQVFAEGSANGDGNGIAVWGTASTNIYVVGELIADGMHSGRVYRSDGTNWQQVTEVGSISTPGGISGSSPADVWVSLRASGTMLHYAPPPPNTNAFNLGQIPDAQVWPGQTLEFQVAAGDLGAAAALSASVLGSPLGTVTFDPVTGRLRYVPVAADVRPFTVRIVATLNAQTRTQDVQITPMPHLPPEETTLSLTPVHPLPDPESKDYIVRQETFSEVGEDFNTKRGTNRTVVLMGKDVVFQRGHPNGLFDSYHDAADIKSLTIYAERMIVRNALKLPQTEVTIYARELAFQDGTETASISTTPRSIPTRAASATGGNPGQNGANGLRAGNITLHAEQLVAVPGPHRFILVGGNGQPAGLGQDGAPGTDIPLVTIYQDGCRTIYMQWPNNTTAFWFKQTHCTGCVRDERRGDWASWPGDGGDALAGGKPGNAGDGGDLFAVPQLQVASLVDFSPGTVGASAPGSTGGRAGTPTLAYRVYYGCEDQHIILAQHSTRSGANAPSPVPDRPAGNPGSLRIAGDASPWLSPHSLRLILAHAKDAYLYGHFAAAQSVFSDYDAIITHYSTNSEWQALSPEWQAEFTALQSEMQAILHRLANNLDYFGNPAGWVPMLSFEANLNLFRNEIEPAIRTLYLSRWVGNAASNLQQKVAGLASARGKLSEEVERFRIDYAAAMEAMPALETEYIALSNNTERVQRYLEQLEQELEDRARNNVEDRHKLPSWKKDFKVASAVMSVIPVYQPALGAIGQGLNVIADYDSDNPLATVQGLAGVAGEFSGGKMKQSMASWKSELDKLSLDNFTQRGVTVTNCVYRTNCTVQIVNGVPTTNCVVTTDCSERTYSPIEFVKNLEGYGKALGAGYKVYRELNQKAQAPANEIEAELQKLKASDPVFNQAVDEISKLMAQKELYARKLAEAVQAGARLSDGIINDLLAIDALNRDSSLGLAILDARAVSYLKEMERRAKERLLKYHYYLAKSYEYRLLRPYTGELRLDPLFNSFRDLIAAGKGEELSLQDFEALRAVYEEQLSSVAQEIVDIFNTSPTERSATIPVEVSRVQLAELRPGRPIKVRLQRREWFFPSEENLRIANLELAQGGLGVSFPGQRAPFKLTIAHSGISHLAYDGKEFLFRHYNDSTRSALRWGVRYNNDGSVSPEQPSDATQSLLYSLLSRNGLQGNILLFARPAVDADLEISLETSSINVPTITNLALRLTFDYTDRRTDLRTLDVVENANGLAPYFNVGTTDLNGKQDGRGGFRRTFRGGTQVRLEAPVNVGKWWFSGWVAGQELGSQATNRTLQLDMSSDVVVRADYRFIDEPDFDNDGLPDPWEMLYFGSLAFGPQDDPDQDGVTNLEELTTGGIPDFSGSPSRILHLGVESGQLRCVWSTMPGRVYQLQIRQVLGAGEWQNYGAPMVAPGNIMSLMLPMNGPTGFIRVVASE